MGYSLQIKTIRDNAEYCYYCGNEFTKKKRRKTLDHITPRSKGGKNGINNLVPCCKRCNTFKGNLTVFQVLEKIESRLKFETDKNRINNLNNMYECFKNPRGKINF